MLARLIVCATLACLTVAFQPQPSQALTCGSWKEAEKSIRWWWEKAYPKEKILTISQNGPPQTYSKVQSTNQKKIDEYGNEWEYYKKNPYCRVPAKVKVQQSSGPRIFNVSAIFKVAGKKFTFDDVATGGSEAVLEPGQAAAPGNDEIKKLFSDKIIASIPPDLRANIQIDTVEIAAKPSIQRYDTGQSSYMVQTVDLYLAVDGEKQRKCEIWQVELFKGEENKKSLDAAAGPWQLKFNLKDTPSVCLPHKYASKVYDFANNIVVQAPPPVDTSWMKNVVGVYKGDIQAEVYNPVTTVLTVDNNGTLSGTFDYTERKKHVTGTISNCSATRVRFAKCTWQDQEARGELEFQFTKDLAKFSGSFWNETMSKNNHRWDGEKTSAPLPAAKGDAPTSTSEAQPANAAPTPKLNKMLKGFGF